MFLKVEIDGQTAKRRGLALRIPALYTGGSWVCFFARRPVILAKGSHASAYSLLAAESYVKIRRRFQSRAGVRYPD
jgi:hypothetical protein